MTTNSTLLYLITFLMLINITLTAQDDEMPANDEEASSWINKYLAEQHRPESGGAALAIVRNGAIVYQNAWGMANVEYDIPNEVNTVFHAASLSKQFTAYSIMLLAQRGQLSLDDDVRMYLPEVPDFGATITLRQLANHQSGLRDQWRLLHLAGRRIDDVILQQDILQLVQQQRELNFLPGSKTQYSNTGFTLLAEVVAKVSGKSFAEFTQEHIFIPLEMTNSQFYDDYQKTVKNRAYSYQATEEGIKKNRLNFATVGATSLFTTAADMCKWAIHLNTLHTSNPELAQRMNQRATLNDGSLTESANGQWNEARFRGMEWFDHSGSDASYRSYFARFPESNSAVIILANKTPIEASGIALGAAELFLHKLFKVEEGEKENATTSIQERERGYRPVRLSTAEKQAFCGQYWEPAEYYDREIKLVKDTLIYYRNENSQSKLLPVGTNEFKMLNDNNDASVFFEVNERGENVMRLNINDERTVHFVKYAPHQNLADYPGSYRSPELNSTVHIQPKEGQLQLTLANQPPVELTLVKKGLFKSSNRHFRKVEFVRNPMGKISHLLISNGGADGVRFAKE